MNRDGKVKMKQFEQQLKTKELEQQQELEQQRYQNKVANCKSSNIIKRLNPFLAELTCFVRNYCLMFLSMRRNLQAFQVGRRKCKM